VPVKNPSNFRDLAAHVSTPLVRGTLYRSDHLGALDDEDARAILALGITRVLDFRGVDERAAFECKLPGVQVHSLSIEPTIVQVLHDMHASGQELREQDVVEQMRETYRGFVRTSTHRFAEFFGHLLERDEPTVFHCTAGKDRTGFAAALVLRALDVPQEEVLRDYMITNDLLRPMDFTKWTLPEPVVKVLCGVQPRFLESAFDEIEAQWGGFEPYLRYGLGLREPERARLRELYLRPPRS
jgi:protein-tyrosine phosphatase